MQWRRWRRADSLWQCAQSNGKHLGSILKEVSFYGWLRRSALCFPFQIAQAFQAAVVSSYPPELLTWPGRAEGWPWSLWNSHLTLLKGFCVAFSTKTQDSRPNLVTNFNSLVVEAEKVHFIIYVSLYSIKESNLVLKGPPFHFYNGWRLSCLSLFWFDITLPTLWPSTFRSIGEGTWMKLMLDPMWSCPSLLWIWMSGKKKQASWFM